MNKQVNIEATEIAKEEAQRVFKDMLHREIQKDMLDSIKVFDEENGGISMTFLMFPFYFSESKSANECYTDRNKLITMYVFRCTSDRMYTK